MAGSGTPQPPQPPTRPQAQSPRPTPPAPVRPAAAQAPVRKPPQVLAINRREEQDRLEREATEARAAADAALQRAAELENAARAARGEEPLAPVAPQRPARPAGGDAELFDMGALEGLTMADLLGPDDSKRRGGRGGTTGSAKSFGAAGAAAQSQPRAAVPSRTVDEFDFDEEAFLAALDENEFVGSTGEVAKGVVVGVESDGVYVDIGGKAPGFMPKKEAALGVITNLKERFPRGLEVEVLVTREQNADGMVTVSARALALRQSWEKVRQLEKEGKVVQVKVNGFNRGGVTADLEGLRGFIPRSQLQEGENHEALVGKTLGVVFLEVNPETRKLVLSEKKAASAALFQNLEVGQLVEGQVVAVKPYGLFVDLGGVSGLLHQSSISGGQLRDLREVFDHGDRVKALITELDPSRGRIALNTALLEGQPGELLIDKEKVMAEATDRANRARNVLRQQEQNAG
ncbi:S1 RNA-binding domain-containing protein [Vulcanococcus limneticus]|uniref:S1 RNA-binding domain-containing protein n=2 Tax=Vulcanococcus limneticus TaxID=2170428 RepID=UPI0020CEE5C2|nr:S1 RNA-binding domain-containing protein [Vulcanococcus limneticus]MCP9791890.1 S1 RNA-binding domain-containing protein [Vulcanococcus limneticus MW73D5]MCP9893259.1 S1 RNA-binding domain-containing protein [Vulcanococcus limneticus Candia 3F8]MCP9897402.1 S1 RNA-binding domain-containing protein [Vulcanococcus limneticus Candia 3B3]